jgi:hypothetical protein
MLRVLVEVWRNAVPAALLYKMELPVKDVRPVPPLATPIAPPVMKEAGMVLVATTVPLEFVERSELVRLARVRAPAEEKDEVAEPPKYAVPVLEKSVEEALAKDWRPLQTLAVVVPKARLRLLAE